jgi:DNA-binding PadR family transcriptional regulator
MHIMGLSQELARGTVMPIVLSLLNEQPMYGYELVKTVNDRTNGVLQWKEGTLYPLLHKMQGQRLIKAQWQTAEDTGKDRKYYHITPKGQKLLTESKSQWQQLSDAVNVLLALG